MTSRENTRFATSSLRPCLAAEEVAADSLLTDAPLGIAFFDTEMRFTRINTILAALTGKSLREHVGRPIEDVWPDISSTLVPALLCVRETGESVVNVSVSAVLSGQSEPRHWMVRCYPVRDTDHAIQGMAVAFVETTEQERMRVALRETEERLHLLLDGARDHAIYMLDPAGRIVYWSGAAERITGWTGREVIGRHFSLLFTAEDVAEGVPDCELAAALADGRAEDARWKPRSDGSLFFADGVLTALRTETGDLRGFGHVMRDATDRQEAEEALQQSEARFRFLSEMTEEGIVIHEKNRIIDANVTFARMHGYTLSEVIGEDLFKFILPSSRNTARGQINAGSEGPYTITDIRQDGSQFPVEIRARSGRHSGRAVRVAIVRDITERVQAVEALRRSEEKQRRIAETLQRSMLIVPPRGTFRGLEVEPLYEAALEEAAVGGDFFDAFTLPDRRVVLVVGDVSGKGLEAAARTSEVKFTLRAFIQEHPEPADTLARLNRFLCDSPTVQATSDFTFIVLSLAIIDPTTGLARISVAGAEPPLVMREDGNAHSVKIGGVPLGIDPEQSYGEERVELGPRDTLILTTDGITEARGAGGIFLDYEGFVLLSRGSRHAPTLHEMGNEILDSARTFSGGSLRDDACLLLARRSPLSI